MAARRTFSLWLAAGSVGLSEVVMFCAFVSVSRLVRAFDQAEASKVVPAAGVDVVWLRF